MQQTTTNYTSKNSLRKTLQNDHSTYYWFSLLFLSKQYRLSTPRPTILQEKYCFILSYLKKRIFLLFLIIIVSAILLIKQTALFYWFIPVCLILLYIQISRQFKATIMLILEEFIHLRFEKDNLEKKTLFQLCEIYSKEFNSPSLVDIINSNSKIDASAAISSFVFWTFIYPINVFVTFSSVIISAFLARRCFQTLSLLLSGLLKKQSKNQQY